MSVQQKFKVDDQVRWRSQAQGTWKTKYGPVVAVIPAGADPRPIVRDSANKHEAIPGRDIGRPRDHESYLVLVQPHSAVRTNRMKKPRLYWPHVSKLGLTTERLK